MAGIQALSRAQRRFLVALGSGKVVGGEEGRPGAMKLARWMKNRLFRRLYRERAGAIRRQIRLHLLERAMEAARQVGGDGAVEAGKKKEADAKEADAAADKGQEGKSKKKQAELMQLIKLWMANERRVRSGRGKGKEEEEGDMTFEEASLQLAHPDAPAGEVIAFFRKRAAEKES